MENKEEKSSGFSKTNIRQGRIRDRISFDRSGFLADLRTAWPALLAVVLYLCLAPHLFGASCPSRILFHRDCPGCGLTRAFIRLLQLDLPGAAAQNPAVFAWTGGATVWFFLRYGLKRRSTSLAPLCAAAVLNWVIFLTEEVVS